MDYFNFSGLTRDAASNPKSSAAGLMGHASEKSQPKEPESHRVLNALSFWDMGRAGCYWLGADLILPTIRLRFTTAITL